MILSAAAGPAPQEGIGCVAVSIGAGTYWRDDECGSAQSGDQDDPSSCVPFPPSETDDEERYKSVESIQRFLEEKLKMNKDMVSIMPVAVCVKKLNGIIYLYICSSS